MGKKYAREISSRSRARKIFWPEVVHEFAAAIWISAPRRSDGSAARESQWCKREHERRSEYSDTRRKKSPIKMLTECCRFASRSRCMSWTGTWVAANGFRFTCYFGSRVNRKERSDWPCMRSDIPRRMKRTSSWSRALSSKCLGMDSILNIRNAEWYFAPTQWQWPLSSRVSVPGEMTKNKSARDVLHRKQSQSVEPFYWTPGSLSGGCRLFRNPTAQARSRLWSRSFRCCIHLFHFP